MGHSPDVWGILRMYGAFSELMRLGPLSSFSGILPEKFPLGNSHTCAAQDRKTLACAEIAISDACICILTLPNQLENHVRFHGMTRFAEPHGLRLHYPRFLIRGPYN